jgi:hypothetical protein
MTTRVQVTVFGAALLGALWFGFAGHPVPTAVCIAIAYYTKEAPVEDEE